MIQPGRAGALRSALAEIHMPLDELWMSYVGLGGDLPVSAIDAFLQGAGALGAADYDRLVQAANEELMDRGQDHQIPYAEEIDEGHCPV